MTPLRRSLLAARAPGPGLQGPVRVRTGAQARWPGCRPEAEQRISFPDHRSHAGPRGASVTGASGSFAAPVFFHPVRCHAGAGAGTAP